MVVRQKQSKIKKQLIKDFNLLINQYLLYCIKSRKKQKVRTQGLQRQTNKNQCFYQNVQYVIANSQFLNFLIFKIIFWLKKYNFI